MKYTSDWKLIRPTKVEQYYCPQCYHRYTSENSDGDLCDQCMVPLESNNPGRDDEDD